MGQQPRLQRRFIVFSPNSIVSAFEIAFFPKFPFRCSALFFLRQNSSSNKLVQLFDWKQVKRSDSVRGSSFFGQILSFRPPKWHFYENFCFGGRFFFFAPKFSFAKIGATFRLEMGQQIGLRKRFILFWPNSIVSASEMAFFSKFSFRWSFSFAPEFSFRKICATFRLEIGQ